MKRLIILLLLPVLLAGCMAAAPGDGSPGVSPAVTYTEEGAATVAPSNAPAFAPTPGPTRLALEEGQRGFPVLCSCNVRTYTDKTGRIVIRQAASWWGGMPCTCDGVDGMAIWIDSIQVFYDETIYNWPGDFESPIYVAHDVLEGRDIAVINFSRKGGYLDWVYSLHLFDLETRERIIVPDYEGDLADIPKDYEARLLDVSALDAELLVKGCTYALMPKIAILYGERSRGGDYFEPVSKAYFEEDGTLSCYIREPDFIGEMWLSYTYTDGEYQLTQVRTDNDWLYEPYEPIPGKVLEARYREPGDGLKPAVKVPGMEILLGGEPLGYSEGDYSGRVVGVLCDLGSNEDALYLCVYVHDTWLELDSWTEVYDLNQIRAMDVERPYEWWYRNTPVKYESGKVE